MVSVTILTFPFTELSERAINYPKAWECVEMQRIVIASEQSTRQDPLVAAGFEILADFKVSVRSPFSFWACVRAATFSPLLEKATIGFFLLNPLQEQLVWHESWFWQEGLEGV